MRFWTAHVHRDREPVLLRDGFAWGAFVLGPVWLLLHRAWVSAGLSFAALLLTGALLPNPAAGIATLALMVLLGLSANDLRGWALEQRGYAMHHVVAARSFDDALARLLTVRPELRTSFLPGMPAP